MWKRRIKKLLLIVALVYACNVTFIVLFQRDFMYFPNTDRPVLAESEAPEMQVVDVPTSDGLNLLAWYSPAPENAPTVLLLHGNGGNLAWRSFKARHLIDAGFGVLLLEYRGYGGNEGKPTHAGFSEDAESAYRFLLDQGVHPANMVYYGESLGTGVAAELAAKHPPKALILETPYTSIAQVAAEVYYPHIPYAKKLVKDNYDTVTALKQLQDVPVLVLHGKDDEIIPFRYGQAVFDAANEPKEFWVVEEGMHTDLSHYGAQEAINAFILALEEKPTGKPTAPASGGT